MTSTAPAHTPARTTRRGRILQRFGWPPRLVSGSIATRLVVFSIVLVTLTATAIGSLAYLRARQALEKEARARLTLSAQTFAEHLHRELEERVSDITNWSHLDVMRAVLYQDVDKQLAQFVRQILQGRRVYHAIVCFDGAGREVASAGQPGSSPVTPHFGPTRLSIASSTRIDECTFRVDTPIFNPDRPDERTGVLAVFIDPRSLVDPESALARPPGAQVALTLRSRSGVNVLRMIGPEPSPRADGEAVLAGAAGVRRLPELDGPDLEVIVAESASAALGAITTLPLTLIRIALFTLLVSLGLGVLVAWRITGPIRTLTDTVRRFSSSGQLDPMAEFPRVSGEVGVLAAAFRSMVENVEAAQAEAMAQSRLALLGEVAANIAHEVRTPLSVLKTSAHLLAAHDVDGPERRRLTETVASEVDRLNRVVTDLVDLARPKPVQYRLENVAPIISRAVTFFRPLAAKYRIRMVHSERDGRLRVSSSADQLYQVFLNLIHNAIQALNGPGMVSVRCAGEGDWLVIEVEDTGPGFAPEVLSRLFSPFCTTKADGTGLGLAISRRIVEEHGGAITAENGSHGGARFRIRLPAASKGA